MSGALTPLPDNVPLDTMPQTSPTGAPYPQYGLDPTPAVPSTATPLPDGAPLDHTSQTLGFLEGAARPFDNAAHWLNNGVKSATGIDLDKIGASIGLPSTDQAIKQHQDYFQSRVNAGEAPGAWGDLAGSMAAGIPIGIATKNPFIAGAAYGAANTSHPDDLHQVGWDAGISALGGKVADSAVSGATRVLSPQISSLARTLMDSGVRLTPGQIMGGTWQKLEDASTHLPFIGSMITDAKNRSLSDFNTGAINQALEPLKALGKYGIDAVTKLPDNLPSGHDAIAFAKDALGKAYDAVLPHTPFQADSPFVHGISNILGMAKDLPEKEAGQLHNLINSYVIQPLQQTGKLTGQGYQDIYSKLGTLARSYGASPDVFQRSIGNAIAQARSEMRDSLYRNNPTMHGALDAINTGYANFKRVLTAAASPGAREGVFSAPQLGQAVRQMDTSAGKAASGLGHALMQGYAAAGKAILPSTVSDSGTALRTMVQNGLGAAATGGAAWAHGIIPSLAIALKTAPVIGPLAAMYTDRGGQIAAHALADRPQIARSLANALANAKRPAALAGAAAASRFGSGGGVVP